jgi:GAF domain-containing protein
MKAVGGDHASITSVRGGRFTTVAATSDIPELADQLQYSAGEGPCVDAVRKHDTFRVDELETDPRWPEFGKRVSHDLGMHSLLAHVLPVDDTVMGAVNVYAARPDAFTAEHETLVAIFGAVAAACVGSLQHQMRAAELERALHTSRRIGAALGIIMATENVDLDRAWQVLAKASQDENIKVSLLADRIVDEGRLALDLGEPRDPAV